jgi:hypothetical protein
MARSVASWTSSGRARQRPLLRGETSGLMRLARGVARCRVGREGVASAHTRLPPAASPMAHSHVAVQHVCAELRHRKGARGPAVERSARGPRGGPPACVAKWSGSRDPRIYSPQPMRGFTARESLSAGTQPGGQAPCGCPGHRRGLVDRRCAIPLVEHAVRAVSLDGGWAANRASPPWRTATPCGSAGNRKGASVVAYWVTGWGGLFVLACSRMQRWRALA